MHRHALFAAVMAGLAPEAAHADLITLQPGAGFSYFAPSVSADGQVVVMDFFNGDETQPVRWAAGATTAIPGGGADDASVLGTSGDGSVSVGRGDVAWSAVGAGPAVPLAPLPGGVQSSSNVGSDVSHDGTQIVGASLYGAGSNVQAALWTNGVAAPLGFLGGDVTSVANAISADGSVIAGRSGTVAAAWIAGAAPIALGDLAGGGTASAANGVSADGTAIVGFASSAAGQEAFRWTSAGGMVGLGDLPGGAFSSTALDASADGAFIVGNGATAEGNRGFVWHASFGMKSLEEFLVEDWGLSLGDLSFFTAGAISDDGLTLVGTAYDPATESDVAFIATIPEPSTALLLVLGLAALRSRRGPRMAA